MFLIFLPQPKDTKISKLADSGFFKEFWYQGGPVGCLSLAETANKAEPGKLQFWS